MRFYEASAVLLLIGAATVGPIEGKSEDMAVYTACMEGVDYSDAVMSLSKHRACQAIAASRESTAETCERAMREIGAARALTVWNGQGQPPDGWWMNGQPVLCIPAPTGLKR